jgi:hypothetical protein
MSAFEYLLAISCTLNLLFLFMALNRHLVTARYYHFLDLCNAWLIRAFAFKTHPFAFVTTFERADADLQAFLVIVSCWVIYRLSLIRMAN